MENTTTIDRLWDFLLKPVPLLPDASFIIEKTRASRRDKIMRKVSARATQVRAQLRSQARCSSATTLCGKLEHGTETVFSLCGNDLKIDAHTWMFGEVKIGAEVTATVVNIDGALFARKIIAS